MILIIPFQIFLQLSYRLSNIFLWYLFVVMLNVSLWIKS